MCDLWTNVAHALMLTQQGIVPEDDGRAIISCLARLMDDAARGELTLDKNYEDVHLNIEQAVINSLGIDVGGKLNLARSRNDQVVTDTRLYLRGELLKIQSALIHLIETLLGEAAKNADKVMVGYTHGQPAQPISLGYWFSAYASMLARDLSRFASAYEITNRNPLGSAALAGTSFPINRALTTRLFGFGGEILHALDATSSRDFVVEAIAAAALLMGNFSRLAEEFVVWSSHEVNLVEIDDSFATGSSIMPQKKNPVVAELVRARTGRAYGALMQILTVIKGVPLGYSCDLQEDKPPLWAALDAVKSTVPMIEGQLLSAKFNHQRALELCWSNFSTATELANYLASDRRLSFRQAHHVAGETVRALVKSGKTMGDIEAVAAELLDRGVAIDSATLRRLFDPAQVIARQVSAGGTSRGSLQEILDVIKAELDEVRVIVGRQFAITEAAFMETK
jgi:argininosuccinate lyase